MLATAVPSVMKASYNPNGDRLIVTHSHQKARRTLLYSALMRGKLDQVTEMEKQKEIIQTTPLVSVPKLSAQMELLRKTYQTMQCEGDIPLVDRMVSLRAIMGCNLNALSVCNTGGGFIPTPTQTEEKGESSEEEGGGVWSSSRRVVPIRYRAEAESRGSGPVHRDSFCLLSEKVPMATRPGTQVATSRGSPRKGKDSASLGTPKERAPKSKTFERRTFQITSYAPPLQSPPCESHQKAKAEQQAQVQREKLQAAIDAKFKAAAERGAAHLEESVRRAEELAQRKRQKLDQCASKEHKMEEELQREQLLELDMEEIVDLLEDEKRVTDRVDKAPDVLHAAHTSTLVSAQEQTLKSTKKAATSRTAQDESEACSISHQLLLGLYRGPHQDEPGATPDTLPQKKSKKYPTKGFPAAVECRKKHDEANEPPLVVRPSLSRSCATHLPLPNQTVNEANSSPLASIPSMSQPCATITSSPQPHQTVKDRPCDDPEGPSPESSPPPPLPVFSETRHDETQKVEPASAPLILEASKGQVETLSDSNGPTPIATMGAQQSMVRLRPQNSITERKEITAEIMMLAANKVKRWQRKSEYLIDQPIVSSILIAPAAPPPQPTVVKAKVAVQKLSLPAPKLIPPKVIPPITAVRQPIVLVQKTLMLPPPRPTPSQRPKKITAADESIQKSVQMVQKADEVHPSAMQQLAQMLSAKIHLEPLSLRFDTWLEWWAQRKVVGMLSDKIHLEILSLRFETWLKWWAQRKVSPTNSHQYPEKKESVFGGEKSLSAHKDSDKSTQSSSLRGGPLSEPDAAIKLRLANTIVATSLPSTSSTQTKDAMKQKSFRLLKKVDLKVPKVPLSTFKKMEPKAVPLIAEIIPICPDETVISSSATGLVACESMKGRGSSSSSSRSIMMSVSEEKKELPSPGVFAEAELRLKVKVLPSPEELLPIRSSKQAERLPPIISKVSLPEIKHLWRTHEVKAPVPPEDVFCDLLIPIKSHGGQKKMQ